MAAIILRFLLVTYGGSLACLAVGAGVLYSAWVMSRWGTSHESEMG